jgi:hypothetical protein
MLVTFSDSEPFDHNMTVQPRYFCSDFGPLEQDMLVKAVRF